MRRIQVLPPEVAERIAAGEVIERPSSVVKELVENSLDAGATEVAVTLENGGKSLIEILDNGCGMSPEDLALAIERHATSKLKRLDDLEALKTLGFRGEALPSIAAVSELSVISRAEGTAGASELVKSDTARFEPVRPITFGHFLGSPHGTRVRAQSLFSQVPARLKFLRSDAAEVSQVRDWLERLALAHPAVGFRLASHDRLLLDLRPDTQTDRVRKILSDGGDFPVRTAESDRSDLKLRAFWLEGLSLPQTRRLAQVINGRSVRDRLLQQAMLSPFRQALMPGRFPALALYVEMDPAQIDVNVHPSKTEVRFLDQQRIFRETQKLLESLLDRHGAPAYIAGALRSLDDPGPLQTMISAFAPSPFRSPLPGRETTSFRFSEPPILAPDTRSDETRPSVAPVTSPISDARFAGSLFNTYLLYDRGEELILIDQHAADERIRYERLRARALQGDGTDASQQLLLPETVKFSPEQRTLLESRLTWLERLGFEAEVFGDDTLLFRAVPMAWGSDSLKSRLKSLVERVLDADSSLSEAKGLTFDEKLFEKLASEACHSAVRAGDRLEPEEAAALSLALFRCGHPWNCPHGRPTIVRVPKGRLEEWFQRRI